MTLPFEYVFPAIRGIQAGHEYYVSMCPVRLIPKLFSFDDEEIPAEMRSQRILNKHRVPDIARYILDNPKDYVFSAITVSVNSSINFEALAGEDIGQLKIPMDARFVINDGQHRRAAFEQALKDNPELGDETIAVVFFRDLGLKRSQQMFTDLNRYASRPDASLNILYDYRDQKAILSKEVVKRVPVFSKLTSTERSNLPVRSSKLFTLSSIYSATQHLLVNHKEVELEAKINLATRFWAAVSQNILDWHQVMLKEVSAGEIRREYVHSHAVTLAGLGGAGAALTTIYPDGDWAELLRGLRKIDWRRSNPDWEGRIMSAGRLSKSRASINFLTAYVKKALGLPLTTEEENLERVHALAGR
ncbi:DNA sulfur modification protein DndB [Acaryochloris sp. CCMEE 5410]|uniref:DNA sulfur modification protein DndB n=1 Tax=Acaryochloris sp. CCMEE 5410 TaxID=310037 RepID=UPI0003116307|nr:DNA sulfur modification protein DndB [Acaryochloris sp. CCMEE 5410]KAI9130031.1 DNA sulfur modification protein DndB [Acaryochloris sp. CCMEE 5410]